MSSKSPFTIPIEQRDDGRRARARHLWEKSDWLTDSRAFDAWTEAVKGGSAAEREFCQQNFLSAPALVAVADLRRQYLDNLRDIGFVTDDNLRALNSNARHARVVKSVLVAGLYPQVATVKLPETTYVETAYGTVAKDAGARDVQFFAGGEEVFLHPSSVLLDATRFDEPLLVYHQKVSTSKVFLRDGTMISPWPVLMFGGRLVVDHDGKAVEVDGLAKFQAFPRIA
ncbi:hypothetical protein HK405_000176, partial [Cladochytrium tenue]